MWESRVLQRAFEGLSCMKGNFHVQFLGEGVAATSPPYPTPGWETTQVYPARGGDPDPAEETPTPRRRPRGGHEPGRTIVVVS